MLEPVELRLYPSCHDSLSWSSDGELAVAAGEIVYVMAPKVPAKDKQHEQKAQRATGGSQWNLVSLKTNIFTREEWPFLFPEEGATFSIGEEQSLSHVVSISWSPPGLASYRRCMLAVLTSNLVLSFWHAADGLSKWGRLLTVNYSLGEYFKHIVGNDTSLLQRKQRVRAFCWSPSVKAAGRYPDLECEQSRWGPYFLAVSNDADDIIFLRVKHNKIKLGEKDCASLEVLSHHPVPPPRSPFPSIYPNSLLASSVKNRAVVTNVSWSPWLESAETNQESDTLVYQGVIGLIQGSSLRMLDIRINSGAGTQGNFKFHFVGSYDATPVVSSSLEMPEIKGPLHWIPKSNGESLELIIGVLNGFIAVTICQGTSGHQQFGAEESNITLRKHMFEDRFADWCPITGFTSTPNEVGQDYTLHIVTLSSFSQSVQLQNREEQPFESNGCTIQQPLWQKQVDSLRNRFDLNYDLGGTSMAKTWGIANYRGWMAACCTFHPTEMVQHITASQERATIIFVPPNQEMQDHTAVGLPWHMPLLSQEHVRASERRILQFTLDEKWRTEINIPSSKKVLYAAACCVILEHNLDPNLLSFAKETMQWLRDETAVDLTPELSFLNDRTTETISENNLEQLPRSVPLKTTDQLQGAGTELYEICSICGGGIEWYSTTESQCENGHLFVRCGLSFLSIQNPSTSKRCARCDREFLNDESLDEEGPENGDTGLLTRILDTFDTCIYCGGKFRA